MSKWRPIKTAPKNGDLIFAWAHGFFVTPIFWDDALGWCGRTTHDESLLVKHPPTHWMPLPEPPE